MGAHLMLTLCSLALAATLGVSGPANQQDHSLSKQIPDAWAARSDGVSDDVSVHTTAEDVLRALRKRRPLNRVIEPASALARGPEPIKQHLWPEGTSMVSRLGRLVDEGRWWAFVPDDRDDTPSLQLLPNSWLETMARSTAGSGVPLRFVVSGELTEFDGQNFLLARFATRAASATSERASTDESADREAGTGEAQRKPDESAKRVATDAPVDDVLELLQQQQPAEEVISTVAASPTHRVERTPPVGRALMPDGSPLVDRPGRLIADGDWWTFVFESDHLEYPEPPMKLLPNRNVELMVESSARGTTGLVFIVSGEVTVYEGESYLLPRAARRRIDSGNLKK